MKTIYDRPGRYFAIFIFSPILILTYFNIKKEYPLNSKIILILGLLLLIYECIWIIKPSEYIQ